MNFFHNSKRTPGASQVAQVVKNPPASTGDVREASLIPGLARSPGGGHGNPLQYSCLENPRDRGAWRATVHRVAESDVTMQPNDNKYCKSTVLQYPSNQSISRKILKGRKQEKNTRIISNSLRLFFKFIQHWTLLMKCNFTKTLVRQRWVFFF